MDDTWNDYVIATYRLAEGGDWTRKAETIALGMTVGSWPHLPADRLAALQRHVGRVVSVDASLIRIAYPLANLTPDLPALLTATFGKLSMDGKIRLLDLTLPPDFAAAFPGPKLGVEGVREKLGVRDRPLLMSIFKSCVGLTLAELAEGFFRQALGGVDLIKDDEILFNDADAPFEQRLEACLRAAERARRETGQPVLYAINLTGPVHRLPEKARRAVRLGANALLINVLPYGFDVLQRLAEDPEITVPLVAHPALAGALYPSHEYGIAAPLLLGTLMRLAGADLVLFPSPYGGMALDRSVALDLARRLRDTTSLPCRPALPVPSAGIHPGLVPHMMDDFGPDVVINAGGSIHGHPGGAAAGGRAFRAAIAAGVAGVALEQAAAQSHELQAALDQWGGGRPRIPKGFPVA
ncbi:MAG: 2,3-diketo-5-methylthiopentyl-1-phosphate enolase [Candidatus Methylomirabilota bacterium]|nr:2,3-diketo-5-methylthiopentyl-1-phosphate enolase [candidate division NC10 bacterium]PWB42940.1 MAG: 2,3-diketo-5-methylthiopentyl-1-phosphate enolase [candidate division NC10 bacterium]